MNLEEKSDSKVIFSWNLDATEWNIPVLQALLFCFLEDFQFFPFASREYVPDALLVGKPSGCPGKKMPYLITTMLLKILVKLARDLTRPRPHWPPNGGLVAEISYFREI